MTELEDNHQTERENSENEEIVNSGEIEELRNQLNDAKELILSLHAEIDN